jgi:predicted ATPase
MRLERFRVTNFRNINDSGWIDLARTTALVGRNESGKTNLLHALRSVSGPDSGETLSITRDFPADRMRSEYSVELEVIQTRWQLSDEERSELAHVFPQASQVSAVEVARGYTPERRVRFCGLEESEAPTQQVKDLSAQLLEVAQASDEPADPQWAEALDRVQCIVAGQSGGAGSWAADLRRALRDLEDAGPSGSAPLELEVSAAIEALSELLAETANAPGAEEAGRQWVLRRMPPFLYFDAFPEIDGQMNLAEFDRRRREGTTQVADTRFETLLRMAGLDPDSLDEVLSGDPETRRQIVGRAGAGLTRKLRELWTDRPLKVRFNLDGDHFNTLVCDPTAVCDIEVNLNQRSRGFRWFFSFFMMLTAGRGNPEEDDAILLLDEPGLHLHATGQQDLLRHLSERLGHQSILATQSPFMVPPDEAAAVRAVRFDEEAGTTVSADAGAEDLCTLPAADPSTAKQDEDQSGEPPSRSEGQISVPEELVTALFGSEPVLVLENLSDFLYVSAISDHIQNRIGRGLPKDLVLMPAGGAAAVPYLMALIGQTSTDPIVLLTSRPPDQACAALHEAGHAEPNGLIFLGVGFPVPPAQPVEIEDLFDPDIYDRFIRAAYREKLEDKVLEPDASIVRAVERYEDAFARIGLTFSRLEPARLIIGGSGRNLGILLSRGTAKRFERIFAEIREQLDALRG